MAFREWGDPGDPGILLWPGLGAVGSYFAGIASALPGRSVAVDPPGFGRSDPLDPCSYERLVEIARSAIAAHDCMAMVGHSLGAYVAAGLAIDPPERLRAVVLIDGGFLTAAGLHELGMPVLDGRERLIAWLQQNRQRFPDWEAAVDGIAEMTGAEPTPALESYLRDVMIEVDGEIHNAEPAERSADSVLAVHAANVPALAANIKIPTLLLACGQPEQQRQAKEQAWRSFAQSSPLIELRVGDQWTHNPILQNPETLAGIIATWLTPHLY
ncbi:MAG: alpha/beta fold hydrolase [Solirubrobacteraceae bacterium]